MSNKHKHKKTKKRQKHTHHTHDACLPRIDIHPTFQAHERQVPPEIVIDCDAILSDNVKQRLQERLNFVDHRDLRHLSCIRIVNPGVITVPSGGTTTGCYYPKWRGRSAEIWLSVELFESSRRIITFLNWVWGKDRLLETLFHEIGHHKAAHTRYVSKYKHEAFAEKYMQAYRKAWFRRQTFVRTVRWSIWYVLWIFGYLFKIVYRGILYVWKWKSKDPEIEQMYKVISGQLTCEEWMRQAKNSGKKKKKWIHPLHQKAYRKKFGLAAR